MIVSDNFLRPTYFVIQKNNEYFKNINTLMYN